MKAKAEQPATVGALAASWLEYGLKDSIRDSTKQSYTYHWRSHIEATFGEKLASEVKPQDVNEWVSVLRLRNLSTSTVKAARQVLGAIFRHALAEGTVQSNPVARSRTVGKREGEVTQVKEPYTLPEARQLVAAAGIDSYLEGVLILAVHLGLRRGETLGLRWSAIDLRSGSLRVEASLSEKRIEKANGTSGVSLQLTSPKTESSLRRLQLSDFVVETLRRQQHRQAIQRMEAGEHWDETDLVFTNSYGGPLYPSTVGKQIKRVERQAGLREIRFHDLRHTAARIMLEGGARIEHVSKAFGHSSIAVTMDVYAKHATSLADGATSALSAAW
ncbi:tyrosine-type recombinase/integrase [Subtercola boreus]|nr:tyrosine-type recombinase/integrase [Subtercola boreus]